jgi:hypothetical protein
MLRGSLRAVRAARSGTWKFTGASTAASEHYYVMFHNGGRGFFDSAAEHLREKDWFDPLDFFAMLARFEAARAAISRPRRAVEALRA